MNDHRSIFYRLVYLFLCTASILMTLATLYVYREPLVAYAMDWYARLGWVIVPLMALAVLLVYTTLRILVDGNTGHVNKNQLYLAIVTYAAPTVGFIGTIVGLQSGLTGFDNDTSPQELNQAVNGVVNGLTVSLSSTLVGGMLGLASGLVSMLYRHVLENTQDDEAVIESIPVHADKKLKAQQNNAPLVAPQLDRLIKLIGEDIASIRPEKRQGTNVAYSVTAKDASLLDSIIDRIKHNKQQFGLNNMAIKRHKLNEKVFFLIPTAV